MVVCNFTIYFFFQSNVKFKILYYSYTKVVFFNKYIQLNG